MARDTNNDLFIPTNLGTLVPSNAVDGSLFRTSHTDSISRIDDLNDFYTFSLGKASNLSLSLSGISAGARVDLIRNINNSRFGDRGETIKTLNVSGFSGTMNLSGLGAGQYALRVAEGTTPFELTLSGTAGPGQHQEAFDGLDGTGESLDVLIGDRSMTGSLNSATTSNAATTDKYRFRVETPIKFDASAFSPGAPSRLFLETGDGKPISTSADDVSFSLLQNDNLLPGEYRISTRLNDRFTSSDYTMSLSGKPITDAQLSVFVERVSTKGSFGLGDTPDFFVKATIDGSTRQTRTVDNKQTVDFNESLTQSVGINERFIPIKLSVFDSDGDLRGDDDQADINQDRGIRSLDVTYDVLRDEVTIDGDEGIVAREGQRITKSGNVDDDKRTSISFKIDYDTFTFGQTPFSSNTPTNIGTNASQTLTGQSNRSGIFDGRGGHDLISTLDGDDIAVGGAANDIINGGTGDDILFGGLGQDKEVSGTGKDTFVLAPETGVDVVNDFRNGIDSLGLSNGISFEMLEITQKGYNTVIGLGDERLATLKGVCASQIGAEDFVAIDFTTFDGISVPMAFG